MAFNFNWSPLIADTSRARDMLTTALNKSPKPPIIVDDIIVTELNLGSVPPELEILEIGDLAEDKFRGIFKMAYTGDAFLTLKTRVQANPLNTYLSTKPSFASPQPLAASSGLTIPLQITLSDFRLSGFVILVFCKTKGLTLVFRNDPLESLKVSSTFDSIPFVRDYLQKEIEGQLRVLFMDDLPAILHRLSLRLWSPEYTEMDDERVLNTNKDATVPIDPLASPAQDPVDAFGNPIDESELSSLSLDSPTETHASFSQKNLLRLATLKESQRTLSLFTPSLRDTVFRAWAGGIDRPESAAGTPQLTSSTLSRHHSSLATNSSAHSVSDNSDTGTSSSRPSFIGRSSSYHGLSGSRPRAHPPRQRKKRVVDLRKNKEDGTESVSTEASTPAPSVAGSFEPPSSIPEEKEGELTTPPRSPNKAVRFHSRQVSIDDLDTPKTEERQRHDRAESTNAAINASNALHNALLSDLESKMPLHRHARNAHSTSTLPLLRNYSLEKLSHAKPVPPYAESSSSSSGGILEQAWMMKMANEIARKVREEKMGEAGSDGFWLPSEDVDGPPPAYAA
ncbi:hypothetical protein M501DRAFT_966674 [Patellaria atrata CBS 101060]|uniref:Mitochondrial distribution and morphology protein 34 n=1 Tax=Patellaria atrata CBS 101060 TaxID=1346257 RepID=A0A9P4SK74_9PEZI|nr:hypothetical protein M501DRAFT_966674 [Patellaria atrata CBS 101060]